MEIDAFEPPPRHRQGQFRGRATGFLLHPGKNVRMNTF